VRKRAGPWWVGRRLAAVAALSLAAGMNPGFARAGATRAAAEQNYLRVHVTGVRNGSGDVCCNLFSPGDDFPYNHDLRAIKVNARIVGEDATCKFGGVAPGIYAMTVFHDENSNGKFDRDWLGLPEEGYGFSNDAPARLHAPSFDAASFVVSAGDTEISVHMRY
jgi:uncharacterized protein (DUF2141 family)